MNADQDTYLFDKVSVLQSILGGGIFGIFIVLGILASGIACIILIRNRNQRQLDRLLPMPAILGLAHYGYCVAFLVPKIAHAPGVRDPNWYFYITADAGLIVLLGCLMSIAIWITSTICSFKA